jgi:hypothetical protein
LLLPKKILVALQNGDAIIVGQQLAAGNAGAKPLAARTVRRVANDIIKSDRRRHGYQ